MTSATKTSIAIVLDRSGSMASCVEATIGAVNGYLREAKADEALAGANLDLMIFDSVSIDTIRSGTVAELAEITGDDFVPRASTPLYDAIGRAIDKLDARGGKSVLIIVTDGFENASRKHSLGSIKELIAARQAAGWLVSFLGAGLQAASQGVAMGVNAAMTASFGLDAVAFKASMSNLRSYSSGYASAHGEAATRAFAASAGFTAQERTVMGDPTAGAGLAAPVAPVTPAAVVVTGRTVAPAVTITAASAAKVAADTWSAGTADAWR